MKKSFLFAITLTLLPITLVLGQYSDWSRINEKDFEANFPGIVKELIPPNRENTGVLIPAKSFMSANTKDGLAFTVVCLDIPETSPFRNAPKKEVSDFFVKKMLEKTGEKLISSKEINVSGKTGKEFDFFVPYNGYRHRAKQRILVTKDRLYSLMFMSAYPKQKDEGIMKLFFDSFRVKE